MMEEKAGVKKQNSKKGFEKNDHSCSMEGILLVLNPTASQYWQLVGPTWTNQSLSKLWQFWKYDKLQGSPRHAAGAHWHI